MTDPSIRPAAGWYPDPYREAPLRWWDGTQWTGQVGGHAPGVAGVAARRPLPQETPVYTVWIWLVVLLPLVSVLLLLVTNPFSGYVHFMQSLETSARPSAQDMLEIYNPAFLIDSLVGWLIYAATIVFSWLDYRELGRRGVERPFHWAWSFLSSAVYVIGRGVIVRRVAPHRGLVPIWVMIAVVGISLIVSGTLVAGLMASIINNLPAPGVGA
ncbi:hypothetical protein ASF88_16380 [Leifsonia sp. Leaf336]|uniref:DUF2510 domain-containing protein n=1 Tax=Leifsonia sp. Leaf336 TaxID=1736341 RepID=UPI0006F59AB0|nr:DUF2510 domain-containing protein [Leifsonia sp. Leaf336]KQR50807.1 hypothetical protein ASF88_16380 [Leifsonia sp. Leaf336]